MESRDFGEYLKKLRKEKKLTIRQLELYSKVSNAYISQMERGDRGVPSPDILKKLAKPLGVDYEELMIAAGHTQGSYKSDVSIRPLPEDTFDVSKIFDLVETKTDDEILNEFIHTSGDKKISPDKVRALLSYARFLKNQN